MRNFNSIYVYMCVCVVCVYDNLQLIGGKNRNLNRKILAGAEQVILKFNIYYIKCTTVCRAMCIWFHGAMQLLCLPNIKLPNNIKLPT